jgi:rhamnogalacturonyl hydrolase YesR
VPDEHGKQRVRELVGVSYDDIARRARNAVYEFLDRLYDPEAGALHHYYRADTGYVAGMDSGNFLMAINYLVMYDCYQDEAMLHKAARCFKWAYDHCTETHPMFTWQGGVRDGFKPHELYVKYTGDAFWTCLALYRRTGDERYKFYISQFHNFMKQARRAGFKYKYNTNTYQWSDTGFCWRAFGYPITAYLQLYEITKDTRYRDQALAWGEHALGLQSPNGAFYLIDGQYWNSDLTAPELRGLVFLYEETGDTRFLTAARRYADWLIARQREDGAWPIGIDIDDEVCAPNVGPGDVPNIGISLLRLHRNTDERAYLDAAVKTLRYALAMQAVEDGRYPLYLDNPYVKWGFWSWEPLYDYSLSGDQSVHHIRGMKFIPDYIAGLA